MRAVAVVLGGLMAMGTGFGTGIVVKPERISEEDLSSLRGEVDTARQEMAAIISALAMSAQGNERWNRERVDFLLSQLEVPIADIIGAIQLELATDREVDPLAFSKALKIPMGLLKLAGPSKVSPHVFEDEEDG